MKESMTKQEAARSFQVSERTLDRWRAEGWLKCFKYKGTVRFDRSYLEAVLTKKMRVPAAAEPAQCGENAIG